MQKLLLLLFLGAISLKALSQENLPIIKANGPKVDIRVGDDYFAKGGWILDSTKKPDVFSIGSKWPYTSKKVSFITDIDSIGLNIEAGRTFNFIILLRGKTPCYVQIATLANPIFMDKNILIPLFIGFVVVLFFLHRNGSRLKNEKLLYFGYVLGVLFWCMTIVSGAIHGNYHHFKNVISELGAVGTKSEMITSTILMILSFLSIVFSIGFYRTSKKFGLSIIPAILSFSMPLSMIWAGVFPLGNEFHSLAGPLPFLLIFGYLITYLTWKNKKGLMKVRQISLLSFCVSMLIFLRFIKPFGNVYEGLIQRFFYLSWTIWTISITFYFSKRSKETN